MHILQLFISTFQVQTKLHGMTKWYAQWQVSGWVRVRVHVDVCARHSQKIRNTHLPPTVKPLNDLLNQMSTPNTLLREKARCVTEDMLALVCNT